VEEKFTGQVFSENISSPSKCSTTVKLPCADFEYGGLVLVADAFIVCKGLTLGTSAEKSFRVLQGNMLVSAARGESQLNKASGTVPTRFQQVFRVCHGMYPPI
jgi:hypothetical protein